jgi:membrane glycosyltransferase
MNPVYAEEGGKLGVGTDRARILGEKLLIEGPDKLSDAERLLVLADQTVMVHLHQQAWQRSGESLAPWWRAAISEYRRRD